MNKLFTRITDAVEHRAEMGHYWIAAIIGIGALMAAIAVVVVIAFSILKFLGTWVYAGLALFGMVVMLRRSLQRQFPQAEDNDNETGVS